MTLEEIEQKRELLLRKIQWLFQKQNKTEEEMRRLQKELEEFEKTRIETLKEVFIDKGKNNG